MCALIIEEEGDTDAAKSRCALTSVALDEQVSFTQLLTNAAMHPETSHASRATQRFAVALSRHWIKDAHEDLSATFRAEVPLQVEMTIEGWNGQTRKGDNEAELLSSLGGHLGKLEATALAQARLQPHHWLGLAVGTAGVAYGAMQSMFLLVLGACLLVWGGVVHLKMKQARKAVVERFAKLREQSTQAVKALLAEMVEWRRDYSRRDANAPAVAQLLDGISADQYVLTAHDSGRAVIATTAP